MSSRTITINIHDADSSTVTVDGSSDSLRSLARDLIAEADRRDGMPLNAVRPTLDRRQKESQP